MLIWLALLQSTSTPPPPVPVLPPAPRAPVVYVHHQSDPSPPRSLDVTIQGGGEVLWQGRLRVARNQPARISHNVQQAPASPCTLRSVPSYGANGTGFTLNIAERRVAEGDESFDVTAEWTRNAGDDCATQASRKVEVRGNMTLAAGEQGKLTGDAGLIVTLRQR